MADYLAGRDGAERLLAPKVREGYLRACREGRDPALTREGRGREAFVEVEWEEALELAARAIERTYADHGPSAVWGRSYGWKNTGEVNNPIGLLRRLLMLKGGFVQTFNSYSTAAIAAIQKVIAGSGDPDVPPAAEVLEHAERVILWGCGSGRHERHRLDHDAARHGEGLRGDENEGGTRGRRRQSREARDARRHGRALDRAASRDGRRVRARPRAHAFWRRAGPTVIFSRPARRASKRSRPASTDVLTASSATPPGRPASAGSTRRRSGISLRSLRRTGR